MDGREAMHGRADDAAIEAQAVTDAEQAVIWCGKCGIPYAATMTHCSLCGAPLAEAADPFAPAPLAPKATTLPEPKIPPVAHPQVTSEPDGDDAALAAARVEAQLPPMPALPSTTSGGLLGRVRQRQQAMSDDEVDAAAAAIIARARAEEQLIDSDPAARAVLERPLAYLPDPKLETALAKRQERDRVWLIAGFVLCVVLIIVALAVSRYTSSGLLAR